MMEEFKTCRTDPGYIGQLVYGLLQHDKTEYGYQVLHHNEDGNVVFRPDCELVYIDAYGREADPAQWVKNCLMLQHQYGQGQRDGAVYTHAFTLSWHPEDDVTDEQAIATAREFARTFLQGHGTLLQRHFDVPNKHVDVVISAWRELDLTEERPWMRRGKDGQVAASDRKAGRKFACNNAMLEAMNEFVYQKSLANGWVAVDVNAKIRENRNKKHDKFSSEVRNTLIHIADVSVSWRDFFTLTTLRRMQIDAQDGVVRNLDGRWERSLKELNLPAGWLSKIRKENEAEAALSTEKQILRTACLDCAPQVTSWDMLCEKMREDYEIELQHTDEGIALKWMQHEAQLEDLVLPAQTIRRIERLLMQDEVRKKETILNSLPPKEQISYLLMLADAVKGTDELCRDLYSQYRAVTNEDEILEQYWRIYFSTMDLFWEAYRARGKEAWERYREEMDHIYKQLQRVREVAKRAAEAASGITTGALVAGILVEPALLLVAVLFFTIAVMDGVKVQKEEDYLQAVRKTRTEDFGLERSRHKELAQKAMRRDLSLAERYTLLRQLEDDYNPKYTTELIEDVKVYTETPTAKKRELERER